MKIGIVLPTIAGREAMFDVTWRAYKETRPQGVEYYMHVPENFATVGEAWNSIDGGEVMDSDYLFFAVDDCVPHEGWHLPAVEAVDQGFIPAPHLENPDGSTQSCGSLGFGILLPDCDDWTPCRSAGMVFTTPERFQDVGDFMPIHYSVDDDWTWRHILKGGRLAYRKGFRFTHHELQSAEVIAQHVEHRHQFIANAAKQKWEVGVPA